LTGDQLFGKAECIYANIVEMESTCIEICIRFLLSEENITLLQLRNVVAMHNSLVDLYFDFLFVSQHPSGTEDLRQSAYKRSIPTRLWDYGIHGLLEILRDRLPVTSDVMVSFVFQTYTTLSLLNEQMPTFKYKWKECLDDV
ncbi:hypothetical protein LZ30DRAFT_555317, partial [Colletotrichum cereale]